MALALVICAIAARVGSHAEPSLFPPGALYATAETSERYEPADTHDLISPAAVREFGQQRAAPEGRAANLRTQLFDNSHNTDWIEANRRGEMRRFNPYSNFSPLNDDRPSYQVWENQQHHGRLNTFGFNNAFSSPGGFGHGGFQGQFSQSAYRGNTNRQPNFQFGPLTGNFTGHTSAEWIDSVPSSVLQQEGLSDSDDGIFILSGGIETAATLQVTEQGFLNFNLGIGVDYYPDGRPGSDEQLDVQVLPSSYASYEFGVGHAQVTVYDRFARFRNRAYSFFSLDPLDFADYQDHAIGATVQRPLNDRLSVEAGYEYSQIDSLDSAGELLDRDTQNVFGNATYSPEGAWQIGVQASASSFDYEFAGRPDGSSRTIGVFGNLPLSDYTRISANAGVHSFDFDRVDSFIDSESLDSDYWSLALENDLNDRFTHTLSVGQGASIGTSSNFVETDNVNYQARWRVLDATTVTARASFLRSSESGGIFGEEIETTQYSLGVRHELTEHTSIGANFSQSLNTSDLAQRDYDQQRLQLFCDIELNDKLDLRVSYQRWDVTAQSDAASFDQNSASIGLTFHF